MNDIEDRLRGAFGARADTVRPHSGAHTENARRIRRARTRRTVTVPAVALATAAAIAAAPLTVPGLLDGARNALDGGTGRSPGDLVDEATVVTIPGTLPGGAAFRPRALGQDGSVVGRTADGRVWTAGAEGGEPSPLGVRAQTGLATGPGLVTWIAPEEWGLHCRTPQGRTRVIGRHGTSPHDPVLVDGGVIIAHDVMGQPYSSTGCDDLGRGIENRIGGSLGHARAFAYPTLFTADLSNEHVLREIDVRTDRVVREHPLPAGVRPLKIRAPAKIIDMEGKTGRRFQIPGSRVEDRQKWHAAANDRYFAWAVGGRLRITDRKGWKTVADVRATRRPTEEQKAAARLTAGDRVIAYTVDGRSIAYDTESETPHRWQGAVLAAGDWLLWRDGRDYRLGRVR